ncbi:metallophosphoesterase family protein [Butyrivibrio sp. WCD3002]|uniref:metallophosphoesterase family protein n=1 Tax=Butyrivibrio sp. WCD3002 TaxID=1280676 RepID=UPI00042651F1|nr:metallophosphoesterase family protein [Butyrivibrio sp. WCD3002]
MNMSKILVISDSHGYSNLARKVIEKEYPFDFLVHCGDVQGAIADIVLFGHTHYAEIIKDKETGIVLVNPGTICYQQFSSDKATYAVITVTDDYEIIPEIKEIEAL